jgi:alpha-tubulin suppressor-like RCC1 family protein
VVAAFVATACSDSTAPTFPLESVVVDAGSGHTCRVAVDGTATCWGDNASGQLGDGSTIDRSAPAAVARGLHFVTISSGAYHTCAIIESGAAYCWGYGGTGALGDGTGTDSHVPVPVSGGLRFTSISAGHRFSCGVTNDQTAYCWGDNAFGRLGDSTTTIRLSPVRVVGGLRFTIVSAGGASTCGLTVAHEAYCWGQDNSGALGTGPTTEDNPVPRPVIGGHAFVTIDAGYRHSCAITGDGAAYCWGLGSEGQVGAPPPWTEPGLVPISATVSQISAGFTHTCALTSAGAIYCWGAASAGQIGNDTTQDASAPSLVHGGLHFTSVTTGGAHSCGLTTQGTYCWGSNDNGQVGRAPNGTATPVEVLGLVAPVSLVSGPGANHTCALNAAGAALCWGQNAYRQLGTASGSNTGTPSAVVGGLSFSNITPAALHTCGVTLSDAAYCWGWNIFGQAGDGTTNYPLINPTPVYGSHTFTAVSAGLFHSCALTDSAKAFCWGLQYGLGDSMETDSNIPVPVSGGLTYSFVGAGTFFSCALTPAGAAYCWGLNGGGQLGDSTTTRKDYPVAVVGGLTFAMLSVGYGHTCGITTGDGAAYCWGGQDGYGMSGIQIAPVPVSGGLTFSMISAGTTHGCGVITTGAAYCWGNNYSGQLGNSSAGDASTMPVAVSGGLTFASVTTGNAHSCGLTTGGKAYCWGDNFYGQLGRGTVGYFTTPVLVE